MLKPSNCAKNLHMGKHRENAMQSVHACVSSSNRIFLWYGWSHRDHEGSCKVGGGCLANILIETGARKILDDINVDRDRRVDETKTAEGEQQ